MAASLKFSYIILNESNGYVIAERNLSYTPCPDVFRAPIRDDLVSFIHDQIRRNKRQAHGTSRYAGVQVSALSWGTGRAVSRIPRVKGGGTHRSGQGAYGNMCRGGHTFNTLVPYRKWHRKVNLKQKRHAIVSAIAASSVPSLVYARGHVIDNVNEVPLVIDDTNEFMTKICKTKVAMKVLKVIGALDDVMKAKESKKLRSGKGKMRNRRYVMKKGPLLIHTFDKESDFVKAFRNIPGLDTMNVNRMNLLKLAPGGHLGRFIIWTKSAFEQIQKLYGGYESPSELKKGYSLPRSVVSFSSITGLINSSKFQSSLRPTKEKPTKAAKKVNPLKNHHVMHKLNPYARVLRRKAILDHIKAKTQTHVVQTTA